MTLEILRPDDWHHHLRDGAVLGDVLCHAVAQFTRIVAMPNIKPPVRTVEEARNYHNRITASLPSDGSAVDFSVLMTLYLTDSTTAEEIKAAKESGLVVACKLYPAGATTNSEFGVTSMDKIKGALQAMSDCGLLLLVHGEVVDPHVDIFDKEKTYIETVLRPLLREFPSLKVVMEHITTADAVQFVREYVGDNLAATITAHHLLYNRSDIFRGGIRPHMYCLPILKKERHRLALLQAATSGSRRFFLGTDSAPHAVDAKESACGCAGIFTGHAAIELYAEAFEEAGRLERLEGFASVFGAEFYGLPPNTRRLQLRKEAWIVPETYPFGASAVRPLRAGEPVKWKHVNML